MLYLTQVCHFHVSLSWSALFTSAIFHPVFFSGLPDSGLPFSVAPVGEETIASSMYGARTVRRRWPGCRSRQPAASRRCRRFARATGPSSCRTPSGTSPCPTSRHPGSPSRRSLPPNDNRRTRSTFEPVYSARRITMHCHFSTYQNLQTKNGSPYTITERRVPEPIPVLGSQPAGDVVIYRAV